jgi:hypothetical protein
MSTENPKLLKAWHNEATGEYMTCKMRFVYPVFLEAKTNKKFPNNPPKFSGIGLVPKACDISVISTAVLKFAADLYGANWREKAAEDPTLAVKIPIKKTANNDKLKEFAEEYPLLINVSANADFPPVIFGPDAKPLPADKRTANEVYGGRWGAMAVNIWGPKPENKNINRFVSIGLQRVQLLDHDDPIATGRIATAEGFDSWAGSGSGGSAPESADALFD